MSDVLCDYHLRSIEEHDLSLLLEWRNSLRVHNMMLTAHEITWEEHYAWFKRMETQSIKRNFVFEYREKPIGYIGYTEYDEERNVCSPSAYLGNVGNLPVEAALCLFYVSVDYPFRYLEMGQLSTDIFSDNTRALKLDMLLGYDIVHGQDRYVAKNGEVRLVHRLILTKEKWQQQREKISKYFPFFKSFVYV